MNTTIDMRRKGALAAIHAAKRTLDLEETEYRDLIERVSATKGKAVRSAKDLSPAQLAAVLDEFKRKGGVKASPNTKGKPANFDWLPPMITKIEALLADLGLSWAYADAIAKRQFKIERVAWCRTQDQLRSIIAALHVEHEKRGLLGEIEANCARLSLTLEQLEEHYGLGSKRWRRNREALKTVHDRLAVDFHRVERS
jgi:phage gp16-like protein